MSQFHRYATSLRSSAPFTRIPRQQRKTKCNTACLFMCVSRFDIHLYHSGTEYPCSVLQSTRKMAIICGNSMKFRHCWGTVKLVRYQLDSSERRMWHAGVSDWAWDRMTGLLPVVENRKAYDNSWWRVIQNETSLLKQGSEIWIGLGVWQRTFLTHRRYHVHSSYVCFSGRRIKNCAIIHWRTVNLDTVLRLMYTCALGL